MVHKIMNYEIHLVNISQKALKLSIYSQECIKMFIQSQTVKHLAKEIIIFLQTHRENAINLF